MKRLAVLLLLVLLAGCTSEPQTSTRPSKTTPQKQGSVISIQFQDFPEEIERGSREYFRIKITAGADVENVLFSLNLPGVESNCNGDRRIGSLSRGESADFGCYLAAPEENGTVEGIWRVKYSLPEESAEVRIKVRDSEEGGGESGRDSERFENVEGSFSVTPAEAVEGTHFRFELELDDPDLVNNEECWCSVESVRLSFPQGFQITGLDGWRKFRCGERTCYSVEDVRDVNEDFYATIRVTQTTEFTVTAELENVWKGDQGDLSLAIT